MFAPTLTRAQQPTLSPERQAAVMEANRLVSEPAAFVLQHQQELALSGPQVASLQKLAAALRDSSTARMSLMTRQVQQRATLPGLANAMDWSGSIDEAGIREAVLQQSAMQADLMIAMARDRRAVGALLTPEQRAQLPQLQTAEMLKAARGGRE